jgi:predicted nucleic acid-binding protein
VIVYVESNCFLEIALEQEQSSATRSIISLAENHQIGLAYPSFALSEPFENIMRARRERNITQKSLEKILIDLERSESHKQIALDLKPAVNALESVYAIQMGLLCATIDQLLSVGRCISMDASHFREALAYQRSLELSLQDSIIYSAVVADLKKQPIEETKCFLSRDRKAFGRHGDRRVKVELGKYNCRYIDNFTQGLDFIQNSLKIG